jgi:UrcA family protein
MTNAFQIAATAFLITAAVIKATPALAAEPVQPAINVSHVRTADLDLSTTAGQRVLDLRLAHAAREVCGIASDVDLEGKNNDRKCRVEVLANAKNQRDELVAAAGRGATVALANAR